MKKAKAEEQAVIKLFLPINNSLPGMIKGRKPERFLRRPTDQRAPRALSLYLARQSPGNPLCACLRAEPRTPAAALPASGPGTCARRCTEANGVGGRLGDAPEGGRGVVTKGRAAGAWERAGRAAPRWGPAAQAQPRILTAPAAAAHTGGGFWLVRTSLPAALLHSAAKNTASPAPAASYLKN